MRVFGKSITERRRPRSTRLLPVPDLPWRTFALAVLAIVGSVYALVRHYTRPETPRETAPVREIPAPELEVAPGAGGESSRPK